MYSVNNYRVEYFQNSTSSNIELVNSTSDALPDLYPGDISRGIVDAFNDYGNLYLGMGGSDFVLSEAVPPFFQMINMLNGGEKANFTLKNLLEPSVLKSSVESILAETTVQLLHMNIMTQMSSSETDTFEGTSTYAEKRLHVKRISTAFLCSCFAIMAALCVSLVFLAPQRIKTGGDIGSTLVILRAFEVNPKIADDFLGQNSGIDLQHRRYTSYEPSGSDATAIESVAGPVSAAKSSVVVKTKKDQASTSLRLWYPASAQIWFSVVTVLLALTIIGLLEGIQHLSDHKSGFVEVRSLDLGTTILAQYVPAVVALGINLMFGSIELVVAATTPFLTLRNGKAAASRSLTLDYLTKSGPHAFVLSLMNRHAALSVMLMTTFVASFLSIVIPGLYSHISIPSVGNTTVLRRDKFDLSESDISFDVKYAATMLNLITYYGVGYSNWIYDDLAFRQLIVPSMAQDPHETVRSLSAPLSLRTDALRAQLLCEPVLTRTQWFVKPERYSTLPDDQANSSSVSSTMTLPWSLCSDPPTNASGNATISWYALPPDVAD